jgi:DNA-binding beta-propeller fold protein YncE
VQTLRHKLFLILTITLVAGSLPAVAQVVIATVPAGMYPAGVAANAATNNAYVANTSCDLSIFPVSCSGPGTVTVINGASNNTTTVNVGVAPYAVVANSVTNMIYVANYCGSDLTCSSSGTVTVINGSNNTVVTTVTVGDFPEAIAVNSMTNMIYVANDCGNDLTCSSPATISVINGSNNMIAATVTVGDFPVAVAVNSATNDIYVANNCGNDITCNSAGTVTVINANNNNSTATVNVGFFPYFLDLNSTTNNIYVSNNCGNDVTCSSPGTVTVINGANNNTTPVTVGYFPNGVAVNSMTNQIYVADQCGNDPTCNSPGTVTVIDGVSNNTTSLDVGVAPFSVGVNSVTNKVYVTNLCGNDLSCQSASTVSVIDGVTNSIVPVAVGDAPSGVAVNSSAANLIYVPNEDDGTVSVIGGNAVLQLNNVTPCRLVDTRLVYGGGGPIQGGTFQTFNLPQLAQTKCTGLDLSSAATYSLNVTLIPSNGPVHYLTIWPASQSQPNVSTMNSDGRIKANAAIVSAGVSGGVNVFVTNTADVVLDIDGYFAPSGPSTLQFYPLPPCRVADTRSSSYPSGLGPPSLSAGVPRNFPVLESSCIPTDVTPAAYSFNFTAVPQGRLGYLSVWPTGETQPVVSTLNAPTGVTTANAAIVVAGIDGAIETYASNNTDLVIDINGYFAPPGTGGLSLYPTVPCRVLDTRNGNGAFSGVLNPPVDVLGSPCGVPGVPSQSQEAYVLNATVVPVGSLGYLTLWPVGGMQPLVSTLNAHDGAVTSNMAIVPAGTNGKINAFAYGMTNLILDISSYFAP